MVGGPEGEGLLMVVALDGEGLLMVGAVCFY